MTETIKTGLELAIKVVQEDCKITGLLGSAIAGLVNSLRIGELTVLQSALANKETADHLSNSLKARIDGKKIEDLTMPEKLESYGFAGKYSIANMVFKMKDADVQSLHDAMNEKNVDFKNVIDSLMASYVYIR